MPKSFSEEVVAFIRRDSGDVMTSKVRTLTLRALLDTVGVTLAGGLDPGVRSLGRSLDEVSADRAGVTSPWSGRRHAPNDAALLFGMASHMLDYDDVSMLSICHPSAPVDSALIAAILGGVTQRAISGSQLIAAHAIGTEVMIRLGQVMGGRHYALGFHATGTLGVIGAAAAVARLLELDAVVTGHALSIAASMASGLRKNFGSMVKPLHVGLGASNGLRAVRMAMAGVEGDLEAFETGGYLRAFTGGETDRISAPEFVLGHPFVIEEPGFECKRYPCCYMLHKMIEGTLRISRAAGTSLKDLEIAEVRMARGATQPLIHPYPKSGLNGKFSGPYAVAAALADGNVGLASFTDEAVARSAIQARLGDIHLIEEGDPMPPGTDLGRMPVTVILRLKDGRELSDTVTASPGSPEDPMTTEQLREKWSDCLAYASGRRDDARAAAWFEEGMQLAGVSTVAPWFEKVFGAVPATDE